MLRIDEHYVYSKIADSGGMPEILKSAELILKYRHTNFFPRKNNNIAAWEIDHKNIYELIISVFTATLTNDTITIQALVGMLNHKIKLYDEIARVEILSDIVGLIASTGLIEINKSLYLYNATADASEEELYDYVVESKRENSGYHIVSTEYEIANIPVEDRHVSVTTRPQPIDSNWGVRGSVLLGHAMNHHEGYLRISHLDQMGQIPFMVNKAFVNAYDEAPKEEPVEPEEIIQWEAFKAESLRKYEELMASDQRFFIQHNYCSRGRTYSGSYYLNPQGTSFKKAAIQLANREVVGGF